MKKNFGVFSVGSMLGTMLVAVFVAMYACNTSVQKVSDAYDNALSVGDHDTPLSPPNQEDPLASVPRVSIPKVPDSRTPAQLRVQACTAFDGSWRCRGAKPQVMAAATAPIIPTSWTIPAWFIDPANSSGTASDLNDCTTSATACVTCQEIEVHRWGTFSPRLRQNTVITGLSNWSGNGDPCYFYPYYENGATFSVQGNLGAAQTVATGTITITAAKNTTTGQLLNATLPAGGAVGQLVKNTTNLSFAWIYKNVAGNTWAMSQPLTPVAIPVANNIPVEVNSWTTGDTVTMYAPISVYIGGMGNTITNFNGALDNIPVLYHVSILAPVANDPLLFTAGMIYVAESQIAGRIVSQAPVPNPLSSAFINVDNNGIFHGAGGSQTPTFVSGGQLRGGAADCVTCSLQRDVIVGTNTNILGTSSYREVYIDSGKILTVTGASSFTPQTSPVIWGAGTLGVVANSRIQYPLNGAVATFKQSGALFIGAGTTAHSIFTVANVDTVCGGITVTPAALDLAASATCSTTGFGGLAFIPGGASIADFN